MSPRLDLRVPVGLPAWAQLGAWSAALALTTAGYGLLVGPLLRALFGGEHLTWPGELADVLPPPPSVSTLRIWLPGLLVAVALVKGLATHRHAVVTARLGQRVIRQLRTRVFRHLLQLTPDAATALGAGDLLTRLLDDTEAVEAVAVESRIILLRDGTQVVALLAVCLAVEWRLALVVFGVYPLVFLPVARVTRRLRRAAGAAQQARSALAAEALDGLARLLPTQLTATEATAAARFEAAARALEDQRLRTVATRALSGPINEAVGALALAATLAVAVRQIAAGTLAAEHVLSFFVSVLLLYQPVKGLVRAVGLWAPGRAALDRLVALADAPVLPATTAGRSSPTSPPTITARQLTLDRGGRAVFARLDFSVPAGTMAAVVGPNGAGKSSLMLALAGLVPISSGQLLVDGVGVADLTPSVWRARVGWVTQAAAVGRASMRENVTLGREVATEAWTRATGLAGLEAVAARLPAGWETPLGDGGSGLSGGELRRLAFARALLADPRLLVLDEPESHLDAEARVALVQLLTSARAGRTVILFTHDPALAALADLQIALNPEGLPAGEGTTS